MSSDRPNILVVMCDQLKATAIGPYGSSACPTPHLERLAEAGIRYDLAMTPHPLCVPARVSLWTGQYPHTHGSRRNQIYLQPGRPHAFRIWKQAGYRCGLIGKNHCFQAPEDLALFDDWCELDHLGLPEGAHHAGLNWCVEPAAIQAAHAVRRKMPRQGSSFSYAATDFPEAHYGTPVIAAQTIRYLETHRDEPFALWVSFPDPHSPIEAPRAWVNRFREVPLPSPGQVEEAGMPERTRILRRIHGWEPGDEPHVQATLATYLAMTALIDTAMGRILDAMERLDLRRRTVVVFCSDHGDFTGEHGLMDKGGAFYDCLMRVPLIVSCPGLVPEDRVESDPVNLLDIVPTLLTLQGRGVPRTMQGQCLPGIMGSSGQREAAFAEYGAGGPAFTQADADRLANPFIDSLPWREAEGRRKMIRTRRWKYVHDPMGDRDELYDFESDPGERINRVDESGCREVVTVLRRQLVAWSMGTEDAVPIPLPGMPVGGCGYE
jgi:arylsulfatase A-like enzyme